MLHVIYIALMVGGATMLGGVLGYVVRYNNEKTDGAVFSFAAGIMLAASFAELILPCAETAGTVGFLLCLCGIMCGGVLIRLLQRAVLALENRLPAACAQRHAATKTEQTGAILFVVAIAVHNLPEGLAAGVGLGTGDWNAAFTLAAGIALQNVPEGMLVIPPLTHIGFSRKAALFLSVMTGVTEIIGAFLGYFAAALFQQALPLVLSLAGGTMLFVIATDVLADANRLAGQKITGYAFLAGCCAMLAMERLL